MTLHLERCFSNDMRSVNMTSKKIFTYQEVLCLELIISICNDNFRGIRGMRNLSNNSLVTNKEPGESITEIYVT